MKAKDKAKERLEKAGLSWKNIFRQNKDDETKGEYYDRTKLDETNAVYRLAIGARGNGKTYSWCKTVIENYFNNKERGAYIRRYDEEITPKNIGSLFSPQTELIKKLSKGKYNAVMYRTKEYHLCYLDDDGKVMERDPEAFCITAAINTWMTQKGQDRGEVATILFDEFLTRDAYLKNEFVDFMNVISSLIRDRDNAIIYMFANTVSKYSPYWEELGIKGVEEMQQGDIRFYSYGNSDLSLAIEYCPDVSATDKVASKYFAFDNPQLQMISNGKWEIMNYPHLTDGYSDNDVIRKFYIEFDNKTLCGNIIHQKTKLYIFIHAQTKDIIYNKTDVLYTTRPTTEICHVHFLNDCPTVVHKLIFNLIKKKSVFVSTNEVGEVFRSWLINDQGMRNLF